jgi:dTMP kinase
MRDRSDDAPSSDGFFRYLLTDEFADTEILMWVVFEGIDGSGKTTLSNRVAGKLRDAGLPVEHLREGGKFSSTVTQAIRELGRDARNLELTPQAELLLNVTREVQLLEEMTRPALRKPGVVIADRFLYSAEVLARFGRGLPEGWVSGVLGAAAPGLAPDLVVLVDVDPHLARARRRVSKVMAGDRKPPSRKGQAGVGLQHRMRAGYLELAGRDPERWVVIENDGDLEESVGAVFALIEDAAKNGARAAIGRYRGKAVPAERETRAENVHVRDLNEATTRFLQWIDARAEGEPQIAAHFLGGLFGAGVDERRVALVARAPEALLAGLATLDDESSWQIRDRLLGRAPERVARSLEGFAGGHPRARRMRDILRDVVPGAVLESLDGIDDETAWRLREELYASAPDLAAASTTRITAPRAWVLRDRWLGERGRSLADQETARLACKAVTGVDDERAWHLRKQAWAAAPVAALASIGALTSARAWKWRQQWVERAPKAVFATLRRLDDARAHDLRERWAAACKEALDSLQDLGDDRAFALRERCADLWPSTVVKSLGPHADSPRGRALTLAQLARHGADVSLLKHATAIALGAHVLAPPSLD